MSLILALALAFQPPAPPPQQPPLQANGPAETDLNPAHDLYWEDADRIAPIARTTMQRFGACVAEGSTAFAAATLSRDFTTQAYRNGMRQLVRDNGSCFRRRGSMRSASLLFAGAIAESLLGRDGSPLNVRLARAAAGPEARTFSPTDRAALCVVRSVPDDVARLLATEVASDAETAAARALSPVLGLCNAGNAPIEVTPAGMRALVAVLSFRQLRASASASLAEARN